ncbi:hypothetical protein [Mesorhizobium sp. M0589]|uniref:hypothetical protein n=1 Tax=Mesorhizobium sp. M0589 TaxID=2956965 RepID=UPI0033376F97
MTEDELKEGDEVQHKTGRQKMIYVGKSQLGEALCEWTDPGGRAQRDSFSFAALKRYEKPAVGSIKIGRG